MCWVEVSRGVRDVRGGFGWVREVLSCVPGALVLSVGLYVFFCLGCLACLRLWVVRVFGVALLCAVVSATWLPCVVGCFCVCADVLLWGLGVSLGVVPSEGRGVAGEA